MNNSKIKFSYLAIVLATSILLLMSSIVSIFISPNQVIALSSTVAAVTAANNAELWNSNTQSFNKQVVNDIKNKLFGSQNPKDYMNNNYDSQEYNWTQSKVVNARTINAQVGNANEGMIVTLGGKKWMVTSLTFGEGDKKDDIILTLYLASSEGTAMFYSNNNDVKGNNAYCRSEVRKNLLENSNWSLFNQASDFATQYLVQPKFIKYQHTQTSMGRGGVHSPVHVPNEALDEFTSGWHTNLNGGYNSVSEMFGGIRYDAWGDDYLWLPSMTETGSNNNLDVASIWKLTSHQRMPKSGGAQIPSWFRTGDSNNYGFANAIKENGDRMYYTVENALGIRPAIHLNYTEMLDSLTNVNDPKDLESTYNEKGQTIKSIADATRAAWYESEIYENTANYIDITYPNSLTALQDAGEYWVKLEITQSYIDEVYRLVEKDGLDYGWTATEIAQMKEKRKPKFRGTANTADLDHTESDTVRWIKVTIKKAEIDFSKAVWSAEKIEYNAFNQSVTISGLPSFITLQYNNNVKKEVGTYTAEVIDITTSNNNYKVPSNTEISNYPTLRHTWQIVKKKITASWNRQSSTQNGVTISLPKLNVAENMADAIEYTYYKNSGMTEVISLADIFKEFDLTEVKTYWVKATLKASGGTFNATNCTFTSNGAETSQLVTTMQTGSTSNSVSVELTNKKVTFNNNEQKADFSVNGGLVASDLVISYFTSDGTPLTLAPKNAGKYKVSVALRDDLTDFIITGITEFEFEIESLKIKKPLASQKQYFQADGFSLSDIANLPSGWKTYFNIKAYDKDNNEVMSENDNWNFINVNTYHIEIAFNNGINTANGGLHDNVIWSDLDKNAFTVNLEIMPLVFSISGWQDGNENKKPVITGADDKEIAKYFDYVIYELKNGIIIGNMLAQNATLKYSTDYQISLQVKDEFGGNVFLEYNGENIAETEPYKFKTQANPNPGADGDGDNENDGNGTGGGNGSSSGNGGTDLWFGENGKLPLFAWVLIASNLLTALLLIILVIALIRSKNNKDKFTRVAPTVDTSSNNTNDTNQIVNDNQNNSFVNADLMNNSDWTFIVREKDVLNIKALENQNERVLMYACKESEIKKLKKFQNAIAEGSSVPEEDAYKQNNSKQKNKKKKK